MRLSLEPHPDDVYVPLGACQGCNVRQFLDGTPDDLRVRAHAEARPLVRKRYEDEARKRGKTYVKYPMCLGSGKVPVDGSVSFPLIWFAGRDAL